MADAPALQYHSQKSRSNLKLPIPRRVSFEINQHKRAFKTQYYKQTKAPLMPLPLESHVYAKPHPSQRGSPWIFMAKSLKVQPPAPTASMLAISYSTVTEPNCVQPLYLKIPPETSTPSTDAALSISNSRTQTWTATTSSTPSDRTTHHPTTHSAAATGPADQRNSSGL